MKYSKVPFTPEEHITTLESRGLDITDKERTKKYLSNVGYYRLTGYMYHLQSEDGTHHFKSGTSFNDVILHYQFDKKLRILILTYIERIEVALRAKLNDNYSLNHGFFWYAMYDLYEDKNQHDTINKYIRDYFEDPQENFLKAYKFKYHSEQLPPSNMAMETLTLGKLSRLYKGLKNDTEKQKIALDFGLPSTILT
jgi:abortive infection bacteriophage resistance protein